jgi:hypothetical protein
LHWRLLIALAIADCIWRVLIASGDWQFNRQSPIQSSIPNPIVNPQSNRQSPIVNTILNRQSAVSND